MHLRKTKTGTAQKAATSGPGRGKIMTNKLNSTPHTRGTPWESWQMAGRSNWDRQEWIQKDCPGKMKLQETKKERDHLGCGEAKEVAETMTRGTEDRIYRNKT